MPFRLTLRKLANDFLIDRDLDFEGDLSDLGDSEDALEGSLWCFPLVGVEGAGEIDLLAGGEDVGVTVEAVVSLAGGEAGGAASLGGEVTGVDRGTAVSGVLEFGSDVTGSPGGVTAAELFEIETSEAGTCVEGPFSEAAALAGLDNVLSSFEVRVRGAGTPLLMG